MAKDNNTISLVTGKLHPNQIIYSSLQLDYHKKSFVSILDQSKLVPKFLSRDNFINVPSCGFLVMIQSRLELLG